MKTLPRIGVFPAPSFCFFGFIGWIDETRRMPSSASPVSNTSRIECRLCIRDSESRIDFSFEGYGRFYPRLSPGVVMGDVIDVGAQKQEHAKRRGMLCPQLELEIRQ